MENFFFVFAISDTKSMEAKCILPYAGALCCNTIKWIMHYQTVVSSSSGQITTQK